VDEDQRRVDEVEEPEVEAHQRKHDSMIDEGSDEATEETEEADFELHQRKHDS